MTSWSQSPKLRLYRLLLRWQETQSNTPVSFTTLAQQLQVTPARVKQLYKLLTRDQTLPAQIKPLPAPPPSLPSTKLRLHHLLQEILKNQPNASVSLSDLAHTLGVSRERVRVLYRQLAREYPLPPVQKRGSWITWTKEKRQKQAAKQQEIVQKVKALRDKGVSYQQIVAEHGIRISQAQKAITKLIREGETSHKLTSPETLVFEAKVQAYRAQGMTGDEIARKTGKHRTSVYAALRRLDIPLSKRTRKSEDTPRKLKNPKFLAFEAAVQVYRRQSLSVEEIIKKTGRSRSTVYRVLHRLNKRSRRTKR